MKTKKQIAVELLDLTTKHMVCRDIKLRRHLEAEIRLLKDAERILNVYISESMLKGFRQAEIESIEEFEKHKERLNMEYPPQLAKKMLDSYRQKKHIDLSIQRVKVCDYILDD